MEPELLNMLKTDSIIREREEKELSRTGGRLFKMLYRRRSVDITGSAIGFDSLVRLWWELFTEVVPGCVDPAVERGQRPTQRPLGESCPADDAACITQQTFQHAELDSR